VRSVNILSELEDFLEGFVFFAMGKILLFKSNKLKACLERRAKEWGAPCEFTGDAKARLLGGN
jgi:hypothetical protein